MPGQSKKDKKKGQFAFAEPRPKQLFDATSAQNTLADEQYDNDQSTSGTSGSYGEKQK